MRRIGSTRNRPGRSRQSAAAVFLWPLLVPSLSGTAAPAVGLPLVAPYSAQRQVNETIAGFQGGPVVAPLAPNGWVVVWLDGASGYQLRVRTFERDGTPISAESTVDSTTAAGNYPALVRLDDGRYVAAWNLLQTGIYFRFLSPEGVPTGGVLPIQLAGPGTTSEVKLAPSSGDGFVAVWREANNIWMRHFNSSGQPLAGAVRADTLGGYQRTPQIARLSGGGGHILAWTSSTSGGNDASDESIQWRLLDASGNWVGVENQANSFTAGYQQNPDVAALPDGGFALVWESRPAFFALSPDGEPIGDGIDLRCFGPGGIPLSTELTVSDTAGNVTHFPSLRAGPDGELLGSWTSTGIDHVRARRLACRPGPYALGTEFTADDFPAATSLEYPQLAIDAEGDFAIAWESYSASPGGDSSDGATQLRTFTIGRVARWELEEGAGSTSADSAGLVADDAVLPLGAEAEWSWGRPGSGALSFQGGQKAVIPTSSDLDQVGDDGVTIAAWIFLEDLPSALVEPFNSIYDASEDNYVLYLDRDAAELRFKVTDSDGTVERPGIPQALLPQWKWFHVAGVYRREGAAEIYLNGVLIDQHLNAGLVDPVRTTPTQHAALGADGTNDRYYFGGRIDEIEVWRRGLTEEELLLIRGPFIFGDGFEHGDSAGWSTKVP